MFLLESIFKYHLYTPICLFTILEKLVATKTFLCKFKIVQDLINYTN